MKKPNFFIVGGPRCGTSSLHYYLKQHPQIYMSPVKELHHFNKDMHIESDKFHNSRVSFPYRDKKRYSDQFKDAKNEKIVGETSPTYLYSKVAAKEIHSYNPDARILIIVREPVDFLHSWFTQLKHNTDENASTISQALGLEPERKKGHCIPKTVVTPSFLYYSEISRFDRQIKIYLGLFPKNQIKIIIFDDFAKDPAATYRDILKFLGVDPEFKPDMTKQNPPKAVKRPHIHKMFFSLKRFRAKNIFPNWFKGLMIETIQKITVTKNVKKPIDKELRIKLMNKYKSVAKNLSKMTGRDLYHEWGYDRI